MTTWILSATRVSLGAFVLALVVGCGGKESRTSSYILGDNSLDSTPALRAEAIRVIGIVGREASKNEGQIAADTFQGDSLSHVTWRVSHTFKPSAGLPDSGYYRRLDLERQVRDVENETRSLFDAQKPKQGTGIVESLLAVADRHRSEGEPNTCVFLVSNMKEVEDGLLFTKQRLDNNFVDRTIARLQREKKIADLGGVRIFVIGGGIDPLHPLTTSDQLGLRLFWSKYIELARAELVAWEPTLSITPDCA